MIEDFILPFTAVGLAELGDKTQIALMLLAARSKSKHAILAGAFLGFLLVDGVSILLGSWIGGRISPEILKTFSGIIFITFGLLILKSRGEEEKADVASRRPFTSALTVITLAELGDKTQVAAAIFAARYNPLTVLAGTMTALTTLSAMGIIAGGKIGDKLDKKKVSNLAGILFIVLGLGFLFG